MGGFLSTDEKEHFPLKRRTNKKYGWKPDLPDHRDIRATIPKDTKLKSAVDLRPSMPAIYDQGELGSCTANALVGAFQFDQMKQGLEDFSPSRQFLYYNERAIEGTVDYDSGASIRDGMKVLNRLGICSEDDCQYITQYFTERPSDVAYTNAAKHKAVQYRRLNPTIRDVCGSLSSGYPVVFGFTVYESFESESVARTGMMPMPKRSEKVLGGHAVMAVGYDSKRKYLLVRNSWGESFGQKGYFWMPFDFFNTTNCSDVWVVTKINDTKSSPKLKTEVTEAPKVEEPKVVEPKVEEPKVEEPKVESQATKVQEQYDFREEPDEEEEELLDDIDEL